MQISYSREKKYGVINKIIKLTDNTYQSFNVP